MSISLSVFSEGFGVGLDPCFLLCGASFCSAEPGNWLEPPGFAALNTVNQSCLYSSGLFDGQRFSNPSFYSSSAMPSPPAPHLCLPLVVLKLPSGLPGSAFHPKQG